MKTTRFAALALSVMLFGGCRPRDPNSPWVEFDAHLVVLEADGFEDVVPMRTRAEGFGAEPADGTDLELRRARAAARQASHDFGCPAASTTAKQNESMFWAARGCGKVGLYVEASRTERAVEPPPDGKLVLHETFRYIPVGEPALPSRVVSIIPRASNGRFHLTYQLGRTMAWSEGELLRAAETVDAALEQGAKDLACDRAALDLYFHSNGARFAKPSLIVEGCEKRATYLPGEEPPFRLTAVAPIR